MRCSADHWFQKSDEEGRVLVQLVETKLSVWHDICCPLIRLISVSCFLQTNSKENLFGQEVSLGNGKSDLFNLLSLL